MKRKSKLLSILLVVCMVASIIPWTAVSALASDPLVAEAGGKNYDSLQEALKATGTDLTVKLLQDVEISDESDWLTVENNTLTLDLNDHYIIYTGEFTKNPIITIKGGGDLTLTDSAASKTTRYVVLDANGRGTKVVTAKPEGEEGKNYLTVTGGCLTGGNYDQPDTACIYIDGGRFTMNGGTVCGNCHTGDGYCGGVKCYDGDFIMNGGKISGNTASKKGGGVHVNGDFVMNGGEISGNKAGEGGGVYVSGDFVMNGGKISGNAANYGGGVFVGGTFLMTDGEISGNTASDEGGGVFASYAKFALSGGEISGNAANYGGGVYIDDSAKFALSGDVKISGNTAEKAAANLGLYFNEHIDVTGALTNAVPIGVTMLHWYDTKSAYLPIEGDITSELSDKAWAEHFTSDDDNYIVTVSNNFAWLVEAVTVSFDSDGGSEIAAQKLAKGDKAAKPEDPKKEGFVFAGWTKDGADFDFTGTAVTENVTLKAVWKAEIVDKGKNSSTCEWTLDKNGLLTVSGTGMLYIDSKIRAHIDDIKAVVLEEGISGIDNAAFKAFKNLSSVKLPGTLEKIGFSAFADCTALKSIKLPKSVKELGPSYNEYAYDAGMVFMGCSSLKIELEEGSLFTLDEQGALYGPYTYEDEDDNKITVKDGALLFCPLTIEGESFTVPEQVMAIGNYAFAGTKLKEIHFAEKDGTIKISGRAFENCAEDCTLYPAEGFLFEYREEEADLFEEKKAVSSLRSGTLNTLDVVPKTDWYELQTLLDKGGEVKLERDYEYNKDSFVCGTEEIVELGEDGKPVIDETTGGPKLNLVDLYYGDLSIPAGTTLDMNGHTLTAGNINAEGDLTVKNGSLKGCLRNGDEEDFKFKGERSTLTLENAQYTTKDGRLVMGFEAGSPLSIGLKWCGAFELKNSQLIINNLVSLLEPSLTMDEASSVVVNQRDMALFKQMMSEMISEISTEFGEYDEKKSGMTKEEFAKQLEAFLNSMPDKAFAFTYSMAKGEDSDAPEILEAYKKLFDAYIPESFLLKADSSVFKIESLPIKIDAVWIVDGEGKFPDAVTLKIPEKPAPRPSGSNGGGGGSKTDDTTKPGETITNNDGSKTETKTNADGSKTETTTKTDGSKTETTTAKDGSSVTENTAADGSKGEVKTNSEGETVSAEATVSEKAVEAAAKAGESVKVQVEVKAAASAEKAAPVTVTLPKTEAPVRVEIPVENVTASTVAVIVYDDGREEIVKTSTTGEDGVVLSLEGSATVKIVDNAKDFGDVKADDWYASSVAWAASHEVMNGTDKGFEPNADTSRGMIAQLLFNLDGAEATGDTAAFKDVAADDWFAGAVTWMVDAGIAKGQGESFGANDSVTREQLAVMLYNYAQHKGYDTTAQGDVSSFGDADGVSDYAKDALAWAVGVGLINGTTDKEGNIVLDAHGSATRAQVAAIIERFCEKVAK